MREADLAAKAGFSKALLAAIPSGVLVIDRERRVRMMNDALASALGVSASEMLGQKPGTILRCVESIADPERCGLAPVCEVCAGRELALSALRTGRSTRVVVELQLVVDGLVRDVEMLVTASPITIEGEDYVLLVVSDLEPLRSRVAGRPAGATYGLVGRDPEMLEVLRSLEQVAQSNAPVLIQGESGTGKELVAAAIHRASPRSDRLLVPVNCGALSEGLLESELFGHVRGAFTGATRDKKGRFQLADGGTLFLDEVGELTPTMQVRFLRVLQSGRFEPLGSERSLEVDVRIICATNRDLKQEVTRGRFREDLFYRLNVFPLHLPPLRKRRGDIPELARHLLAVAASGDGFAKAPTITEAAMKRLLEHDWPGNVRELENVVRFALIRAGGGSIKVEHLPPELAMAESPSPAAPSAGSRTGLAPRKVAAALRQTRGNKVKAAKVLGVSRATLYRFLDEHGVVDGEIVSQGSAGPTA